LNSTFAPFPVPAWSSALQAVDQSPSRLVEASKASNHYGHYTFPDPGIFVNQVSAAKYLESWLRVQDVWFMHMDKEPSLAMSNQTWRTFLANPNAPEKVETKAARCRQESMDMIMPKSDVYPEVKKQTNLMEPIVWQGKEYPPGVLPPDNVVREILWELYQMNFIHELLSLDRRACADLDLSNTTQLLERQNTISQCFPISSFRHVSIPSENDGLAADNLETRFGFITVLLLVMKSWKGDKPVIFGSPVENLL
jgi:hypothetical protein